MMANNPKDLQALKAPDMESLMEWSTISNVHGAAALQDNQDSVKELLKEKQDSVKELQSLKAPEMDNLMAWSTISNVHSKEAL